MMLVVMRVFLFNMSDHIKYMRVGGRRHRQQQGQLRGEDQGRTLTLEYITSVKVFLIACDML